MLQPTNIPLHLLISRLELRLPTGWVTSKFALGLFSFRVRLNRSGKLRRSKHNSFATSPPLSFSDVHLSRRIRPVLHGFSATGMTSQRKLASSSGNGTWKWILGGGTRSKAMGGHDSPAHVQRLTPTGAPNCFYRHLADIAVLLGELDGPGG